MEEKLSCANCGVLNCSVLNKEYPDFCLTKSGEEANCKAQDIYLNDPYIHRVAIASAEVEGLFYGEMTRVEEIMEFARRIDAKKLGIATCLGLVQEARVLKQILDVKGFNSFTAICKVGATDKTVMGLEEKCKINKGTGHESMCNPILQAMLLNREKTDLNIVVGLCVGHDSLFYKYSEAICTTLVAKDKVLAHNPVGALYTAKSYNKKLLKKE